MVDVPGVSGQQTDIIRNERGDVQSGERAGPLLTGNEEMHKGGGSSLADTIEAALLAAGIDKDVTVRMKQRAIAKNAKSQTEHLADIRRVAQSR